MTDPDLSEFIALSRPTRSECTIASVLRDLKPAERRQLVAAMAKPWTRTAEVTDAEVITHRAVVKWLKGRGHDLSASTVARHRKRECHCP